MKRTFKALAIAGLLAFATQAQARSQEDLDDILGLNGGDDPVEDTIPEVAPAEPVKTKPASSLKKTSSATVHSSAALEEADMARIEGEAAELDTDAYNDLKADVTDETAQLKADIAKLERQTRELKAGAELSKRRAMMEAKKLELKQRQAKDSKGRLDQVEEQKRKEERQLSALQQQVKVTEQKAAAAKEKTLKARAAVALAEKQRLDLEKRLKQAAVQIEVEKKRQKKMAETRSKISAKNGRLKVDVRKAERVVEAKKKGTKKASAQPRRVGQN